LNSEGQTRGGERIPADGRGKVYPGNPKTRFQKKEGEGEWKKSTKKNQAAEERG